MARFELATSSLPRKHTARLCHIGGTYATGLLSRRDILSLSSCLITLWLIPIKHCGREGVFITHQEISDHDSVHISVAGGHIRSMHVDIFLHTVMGSVQLRTLKMLYSDQKNNRLFS